MNRYDSYKDSGIEWMGLIPSNWKLTKNRYSFQKHNNGKNESDETSVLSLTIKGVKVKTNLSFGKSTESYIGHQLVEKGDIVFTPRDFDQTPILSDVSKYNGCISNLYIVDKTKDGVLNHFVNYYWFGLKYSVDYFKNFSHGIRYSFNRFQFDEIPLLLPPLSEQQQIVSYLDTKTSLIDSLIEKTQRKIVLLKEKRTSLINEVVTKGLNPNVEMKDSGVEWIGEIPSGWRILRGKYLFENIVDKNHPEEPLLSVTQKNSVVRRDEMENKVWNPDSDVSGYKLISKGDFVISLRTFEGGIELSEIQGIVSPVYTVLRRRQEINDIYFKFLLKSPTFITELNKITTGIRQGKNISYEDFSNIFLPIPEFEEQKKIGYHIDNLTQKIDKTISIEEKRIELLKEYRQSLISEVVTGKRKVVE